MALSIVQVYSRSAWRVRVAFAGGDPSAIVPSDIAVARQDGGPCTIQVAAVLTVDGTALELILDERLIAKVIYTLTWSSYTVPFSEVTAAAIVAVGRVVQRDLDAEQNGVDLAWLSDPDASGRMQRRTGVACVQYDIPNRAMLKQGELAQAPDAGGNMPDLVNGSAGAVDLSQIAGALEAEFRRDPRVEDASVDPVQGVDGEVDFNGMVKTRSGQSAPVRST